MRPRRGAHRLITGVGSGLFGGGSSAVALAGGYPRAARQACATDRVGARTEADEPNALKYNFNLYSKIDLRDPQLYLLLVDLTGVTLAAGILFQPNAGGDPGYGRMRFWVGLVGFAAAWICSTQLQNLYATKLLQAGLRQLLSRALTTCSVALGLLLFAGFAAGALDGVARAPVLTVAGVLFVWIGLTRLAWRCYFKRQVRAGRRVERALVLAASADVASRLSNDLEYESAGAIGVADYAALPGRPGAPTLDWIEDAVRSGAVDRVILGGCAEAMAQANAVLARLARLTVDVTVLPDCDGMLAPVLKVDRIGMLLAVELDCRPLTPLQISIKRAEDLVIAGLAVLFLLPVLLATAIAVRLDSPGPVLFRQKRAGLNDGIFEVLKFRTMYVHASDHRAACQTARDDRRVTRVGRFLRRLSLDELPQLLNVLTGSMSLVGPRPHALGMTSAGLPLHQVIEEYSARHRLKPGITGWAQVNGNRGPIEAHDKLRRRVALDCYYIENWSLGFDLWIMLRTALIVCGDPNAY